MPVWNDKPRDYEAEPIDRMSDGARSDPEKFETYIQGQLQREERFRVYLLRELDGIARALQGIEAELEMARERR